LADYGTSIVVSAHAHDLRDFLFSKEYNLLIKVEIDMKKQKFDASF